MLNKKPTCVDGIELYIKESSLPNYFAESYYLYKNHWLYLNNKLTKYRAVLSQTSSDTRKRYFNLLVRAYSQNSSNIEELIHHLKKEVTISAFENLKINTTDNTQITLKDFIYLRRDWCFTDEGEKQLEIINNSIKDEIVQIRANTDSALFIGCGVGRLAFDFLDIYKKVYATDKSFSMIWHLKKLLKKNTIDFYCPQEKNILELENVANKNTAQIPKNRINDTIDRFYPFVSDVLDLPFSSKSVGSIYSIYFTDVIALKLWFNEIDDKLVDEGLFIHFGPLDYFFSDEREMLTAEEFRLFFENNGYITVIDKVVETPHLEDSNSISYKVYRNWFFIAQKNITKSSPSIKINDGTILKLKKPIEYERKGILSEGEKELEVTLKLPNGVFVGADAVIQILKLIDGRTSYKRILSKLEINGYKVLEEEIKTLLLNFLDQGVLVEVE